MNNVTIRKQAKAFAEYWKDKGYEKGQSQLFWIMFLRDILGVEHPERIITFEDKVKLDHTSFIDGYIASTKVLIEQKSIDKDLSKAIKQSDGSLLTPWERTVDWLGEVNRGNYKKGSLVWGIVENLLGPFVIPFYLLIGF